MTNANKEIEQLRAIIEKRQKAYTLSLENTKKAALDFASKKFKNQSFELVLLFKKEALKMLEKYTYLRDELTKREELLCRATKYSVLQE